MNKVMLTLGARPIVVAKMKDNTGILVDLRTNTDLDAFYSGSYDPDLIEITHSLFNPDLNFLDIGANIGFYSVSIGNFIRSKGGSGRVVAFEPFIENYNRVRNNVMKNDLDGYCEVNNYGLSNESKNSVITLREDFLGGSNTGNAAIPTNEKFDEGCHKVPIRLELLDNVWREKYSEADKIDFIKMDIEGHEDFCLKGGQMVIKTHRPTILMEVNKPYYDARDVKLDDIFMPLIPEKYSIYRRVNMKWKSIGSLDECLTIDNVFLIPEERLELDSYKIFG